MGILDQFIKTLQNALPKAAPSVGSTMSASQLPQSINTTPVQLQASNIDPNTTQIAPAPATTPSNTPLNIPASAAASLAADNPTANQSTQLTPQVAQQQEAQPATAAIPIAHAMNTVANSPIGQFAQSASQASDPNNGDVYGQAEAQHGGNSPQAYGALVGSVLPAFGTEIPEIGNLNDLPLGAKMASEDAKAGVSAAGKNIAANTKEAFATGQSLPGGLQTGAVGDLKGAFTPTEERNLTGLGYTQEDISKLPKAYGQVLIDNKIVKPGGAVSTPLVKSGLSSLSDEPLTINNNKPTATDEASAQQASPLNPNAERFTQNREEVNSPAPSRPYPDVPDEPAVVTDRQGTHPVTGGNPVRLDFADQAKKNSYYLEDQNKAQAVLDKHVAGDTALEVQHNLPLQLQEESKRIKNTIGKNPSGITAEHSDPITQQLLKDENTKAMQKQGIELGDNTSYDATNKALLKKLDNQLNPGQANLPANETLDGNKLQDYINTIDPTLKSAYKKLDNGTALTDSETAALTMRRTASKILKDRYPDAAAALDRQSAMLDANPYVAKAASEEMKTQNADAVAAKEADAKAAEDAANKNAKVPPFLRGIKTQLDKQPAWAKTAEGVVTAGLVGNELQHVPGQLGAAAALGQHTWNSLTSKKDSSAGSGNSTSSPTIYKTKTPLDDGSILSDGEYLKKKNDLTTAIGSGMTGEANKNPDQYSKDAAALLNNQSQYDAQKKVRGAATDMHLVDSYANDATDKANKVDNGFFTALLQGYNSNALKLNPDYAALAGSLKALQDKTGILLDTATTKSTLLQAIGAAEKKQSQELDAAKFEYNGGAVTPTTSPNLPPTQQTQQNTHSPLNWSQNDPSVNAILNGGKGGGLPPFDQLFR